MKSKTVALLTLVLLLATSAWASTETALYKFCSQQYCTDGAMPTAGVIFDKAGNLYGTTMIGGSNMDGAVFELKHSKSGWTESVLYSFTGGDDGTNPIGPLVFDKAGNLYGTADGGGSGYGTVFELKPSSGSWTFNVIYTFQGGDDGASPAYGGLVVDKSGNLYGTTEMGGANGSGTVFELTPGKSGWTKSTLYSFAGGSDAGYPLTGVTLDEAGDLYGATVSGGSYGEGAVFELEHKSWTESVLYSFTGGSDGAYPEFGAVTIKAGNIYGTAAGGGADSLGVVYELKYSKSGWTESVLYSFTGGTDGGEPFAGVAFNKAGDLAGAAAYYGKDSYGSVFELAKKKAGWKENTLYDFTGSDGMYPYGGIVFDPKGNWYSTTYYGGNLDCDNPHYGCGVVYEVKP
jgi:uncharacterized repeat protein (TIGR03803 family)